MRQKVWVSFLAAEWFRRATNLVRTGWQAALSLSLSLSYPRSIGLIRFPWLMDSHLRRAVAIGADLCYRIDRSVAEFLRPTCCRDEQRATHSVAAVAQRGNAAASPFQGPCRYRSCLGVSAGSFGFFVWLGARPREIHGRGMMASSENRNECRSNVSLRIPIENPVKTH